MEVALGQRPIKAYLGLPRGLPNAQADTLVPEDKLDELQHLTTWIFGGTDELPVISDSRDISAKLAPVVENKEALEHLQLTSDLEGAYERTGGEQQFLLRRFASAERALRDIAGLLPLHSTSKEIQSAVDRLVRLIEGLRKQAGR